MCMTRQPERPGPSPSAEVSALPGVSISPDKFWLAQAGLALTEHIDIPLVHRVGF